MIEFSDRVNSFVIVKKVWTTEEETSFTIQECVYITYIYCCDFNLCLEKKN